jgi:hypothetical protein
MLKESIEVITSSEDYFKSIEEYFTVDSQEYVHSTSPDEMKFIREFGKKYCHTFKDGLNS